MSNILTNITPQVWHSALSSTDTARTCSTTPNFPKYGYTSDAQIFHRDAQKYFERCERRGFLPLVTSPIRIMLIFLLDTWQTNKYFRTTHWKISIWPLTSQRNILTFPECWILKVTVLTLWFDIISKTFYRGADYFLQQFQSLKILIFNLKPV